MNFDSIFPIFRLSCRHPLNDSPNGSPFYTNHPVCIIICGWSETKMKTGISFRAHTHTHLQTHLSYMSTVSISCGCVCGAASVADTENQIASWLQMWPVSTSASVQTEKSIIVESVSVVRRGHLHIKIIIICFYWNIISPICRARKKSCRRRILLMCTRSRYRYEYTTYSTSTPRLTIIRGSIAFKWESIHSWRMYVSVFACRSVVGCLVERITAQSEWSMLMLHRTAVPPHMYVWKRKVQSAWRAAYSFRTKMRKTVLMTNRLCLCQ